MRELIKDFFKMILCLHKFEKKDLCTDSLHSKMVCTKCGKVKYTFDN